MAMKYQKTAEATIDLIGDKIQKKIKLKIKKVLKNLQQRNSETVTNENDKEIPRKINIYRRKAKKH